MRRRSAMRARSLGIISLLLALWLSLSAGSIAAMPYPNDDSSGHEDEYVGEYTYTSTPNGQQLSELAGLSSDVSCQIVVSDPTFHTHNVSTAASQLCSGVFIRQSLIVCVQVERWFLFLPYWADLGCKSNSKSSFFLSVETDSYGYDYGTTRYRTRAVGSFTDGDGTIYTSPNVVSRAFPFTYEP